MRLPPLLAATLAALAPLTLLTSAPAEAAPAACSRDHAAVRRALDVLTASNETPGVTVRIDDPRCGAWSAASGRADLATGRPMATGERTRVGSITKSFTATVVLGLAAEHRLSLEDTVDRWLPGLVRTPRYDGRRITVRSLLRHTSGLPDYTDGLPFDAASRWRHYDARELVALALTMDPPGKAWNYSSTNYVLAGMIVRKVTGRGIEDETTRRILRPLGLRGTYWPGDRTSIRGPHPRGYVRDDEDAPWTDHTDQNMTFGGAAGALVSTTRDLNRFYTALLGGRLLPPRLLAEMRTTVAADPDRVWPGARFGLGLIQTPLTCGGTWTGHAGGVPGFGTVAGVGPGGRAVAVSLNADPDSLQAQTHMLDVVQAALCERP
ncbi:class A beta-lactamase-related serine hydrolase [Actinomadura logoneensis]|uniref:Class A beta-lactamase-related serine hydrolase n=1 Tax=Actinomadura logoneensis TaxID=2293572 RepID=A0A372JE95_9ACTN|nr:serine hydrolase domain-containing protein [Actinomadura logoneensis]RFU38239.1 class A beta-lactamase-related serine hydrolase [Actinomadura logoneensis]